MWDTMIDTCGALADNLVLLLLSYLSVPVRLLALLQAGLSELVSIVLRFQAGLGHWPVLFDGCLVGINNVCQIGPHAPMQDANMCNSSSDFGNLIFGAVYWDVWEPWRTFLYCRHLKYLQTR